MQVIRQLDKWENEIRPTVEVEGADVDFGLVRYGERVTRTVSLVNTGGAVAHWRFVPPPGSVDAIDPATLAAGGRGAGGSASLVAAVVAQTPSTKRCAEGGPPRFCPRPSVSVVATPSPLPSRGGTELATPPAARWLRVTPPTYGVLLPGERVTVRARAARPARRAATTVTGPFAFDGYRSRLPSRFEAARGF